MTASPVVLVDVHSHEHHFTPLPQDIRTPTASAIQAKTQAIRQPVRFPRSSREEEKRGGSLFKVGLK